MSAPASSSSIAPLPSVGSNIPPGFDDARPKAIDSSANPVGSTTSRSKLEEKCEARRVDLGAKMVELAATPPHLVPAQLIRDIHTHRIMLLADPREREKMRKRRKIIDSDSDDSSDEEMSEQANSGPWLAGRVTITNFAGDDLRKTDISLQSLGRGEGPIRIGSTVVQVATKLLEDMRAEWIAAEIQKLQQALGLSTETMQFQKKLDETANGYDMTNYHALSDAFPCDVYKYPEQTSRTRGEVRLFLKHVKFETTFPEPQDFYDLRNMDDGRGDGWFEAMLVDPGHTQDGFLIFLYFRQPRFLNEANYNPNWRSFVMRNNQNKQLCGRDSAALRNRCETVPLFDARPPIGGTSVTFSSFQTLKTFDPQDDPGSSSSNHLLRICVPERFSGVAPELDTLFHFPSAADRDTVLNLLNRVCPSQLGNLIEHLEPPQHRDFLLAPADKITFVLDVASGNSVEMEDNMRIIHATDDLDKRKDILDTLCSAEYREFHGIGEPQGGGRPSGGKEEEAGAGVVGVAQPVLDIRLHVMVKAEPDRNGASDSPSLGADGVRYRTV